MFSKNFCDTGFRNSFDRLLPARNRTVRSGGRHTLVQPVILFVKH
jgi:hypothetical protein